MQQFMLVVAVEAQEALTTQEALVVAAAAVKAAVLLVEVRNLLLEQLTVAVAVAVAQGITVVLVAVVVQESFFSNTLTQEQSHLVLV
jgi:7-cyano-7-deazaguanine synthase in queuosine biosynthesis